MKITREEFYKLTGEYPEDVLGEDWENTIENYLKGCIHCKTDTPQENEETEFKCPNCGANISKDNTLDYCFDCKKKLERMEK